MGFAVISQLQYKCFRFCTNFPTPYCNAMLFWRERSDISSSLPSMRLSHNPTLLIRFNRRLLLQTASTPRRLRLRRKLLQRFHRHAIRQSRLVRRMEEDPAIPSDRLPPRRDTPVKMKVIKGAHVLRHNRIIRPLRRLHRLSPPCSAKTPFTPRVEAGHLTEIITPGSGKVEEFFGQYAYER